MQTYGATVAVTVVGQDRRFMAEAFAQTAAASVSNAGFDVLLAETYAPTPAFSGRRSNTMPWEL